MAAIKPDPLACVRTICAALALHLLGGCATNSHVNESLGPGAPPAPALGTRATFNVDGDRGNEDVIFFLALSGGGSRAAYMSALTMLRLQEIFDDVDLLEEVDVISSVSGGSLPAAYYAISRDQALNAKGRLAILRTAPGRIAAGKLRVDSEGRIHCERTLSPIEAQELRQIFGAVAEKLVQLCERPLIDRWRRWDEATVTQLMSRNYIWRWVVRWFYPENFVKYWFTAFDRADMMAQTLEDGLLDTPLFGGRSYNFSELNPQRPYLILNATSATGQDAEHPDLQEKFAFGSVFTFTEEDFRERLHSTLAPYPVSYAVMASSAFPLVFANVTLGDFRAHGLKQCAPDAAAPPDYCRQYYLHVFDGGNSDNLGLKSVKRALFKLATEGRLEGKKIVVLQVDAFARPIGAKRTSADPRSLLSLFLDANFVDAVDALLQHNRATLIGEFQSGTLGWDTGDCAPDTQSLPPALCESLDKSVRGAGPRKLDLQNQLFFYHFGFDDVAAKDPGLKARLDRIPTSFAISRDNAKHIEDAVRLVITRDNACLQQIQAIVRGDAVDVPTARRVCEPEDRRPQSPRAE